VLFRSVISALQIKTQNKEYFEIMAKKRLTAIAFEYIRDDDGNYPAVRSLSEIAGISSILIAPSSCPIPIQAMG
jgi:alanine dehydrogenase